MKYLLVPILALGLGTAATAASYPPCSKTVHDQCVNAAHPSSARAARPAKAHMHRPHQEHVAPKAR